MKKAVKNPKDFSDNQQSQASLSVQQQQGNTQQQASMQQSTNSNQPVQRDSQRKPSNAMTVAMKRQSKLLSQSDELALRVMQKYSLERFDLEMIHSNFKKFDPNDSGRIQFYQLLTILQNMQFTVNDAMKKTIFKELEDRGLKQIEMETVCLIVGVLRQKEQKLIEEHDEDQSSEFIDAFVALGGNPDSTGKVMKSALIKIIKEEFDLIFDIESTIMARAEASTDELDYHNFCLVFDSPRENRQRRSSRASTVLSAISRRSAKSVASVKIRQEDFENFCQNNM